MGLSFERAASDLLRVFRVVDVDPGVERGYQLFVADGALRCVQPCPGNGSVGGHRVLALIQRDEISLGLTGIELPWATNAISTADHFVPMRNPPDGPADGENHRKH